MYLYESIKEFLKNEDFKVVGNLENISFLNVLPFEEHNHKSIIWIKNANANLENLKANLIIANINDVNKIKINSTQVIIGVKSPKLIFSKIINCLFIKKINPNIHSTAIIDIEAIVSKTVYIGPNVVIGKCKIGENVVIHGNCFIFDNVTIGNNVTIFPGVVIGADGFGYSKSDNGEIEKFPHVGGVIIEDNVEIGSNTCIDRGALGKTIIRKNAKIDNLVHIAHNVDVGENTFIIANCVIGGSVKINNNVWIAPSVSILQQLKIEENVTIGVGAVVTKNIPKNEIWIGNPANEISKYLKNQQALKSLK